MSEGAGKFFKEPLEILNVSQRGMLIYIEDKIPSQEDLQFRITRDNGKPAGVVYEDKLVNRLYRVGLFMSESFLPMIE